MNAPEGDLERTVAQTYIPRYQRDQWDEHADELDMNRSEFIRSMVQAGRRGFEKTECSVPTPSSTPQESPPGQTEDGTCPHCGSESTEKDTTSTQVFIIEQLQTTGALTWDELLEALAADVETDLESALQALQAANRVHHSGPQGGYVLSDSGEQSLGGVDDHRGNGV